jgi:hypothetical protein
MTSNSNTTVSEIADRKVNGMNTDQAGLRARAPRATPPPPREGEPSSVCRQVEQRRRTSCAID